MSKTITENPIALFKVWLAEAVDSEPNDPTAMTLATADKNGVPSARMILLKDVDEQGFSFYTNSESQKGLELDANGVAALVFHWKSLRRQVTVAGRVDRVTASEADNYFTTRPRGSQIGAWAADQSRPLEARFELEKRVAKYAAKFGTGIVPRPSHWTGYRVMPRKIEFWRDKPFRLHERIVYEATITGGWTKGRLYP